MLQWDKTQAYDGRRTKRQEDLEAQDRLLPRLRQTEWRISATHDDQRARNSTWREARDSMVAVREICAQSREHHTLTVGADIRIYLLHESDVINSDYLLWLLVPGKNENLRMLLRLDHALWYNPCLLHCERNSNQERKWEQGRFSINKRRISALRIRQLEDCSGIHEEVSDNRHSGLHPNSIHTESELELVLLETVQTASNIQSFRVRSDRKEGACQQIHEG